MTSKASFFSFILIFVFGLFSACQKDNSNAQEPIEPDTPVVTEQAPPIDEYMPERLLHLFDSLNVLHRGDNPPTITGDFMTESMNILLVNKIPGSNYMALPGPIQSPYYYEFEFKNQENDHLGLSFKSPKGEPQEQFFFLEKSDTDNTYLRIKDSTAYFTNDPIAPSYFRSNKFTAEDFKHAYIIGNGDYFTLYYYEIRDISGGYLPLNAILISGKLSTDVEGNPIIENFWCGVETMKYFTEGASLNLIIQYGPLPTPGDIIIMQSPNTLVQGSSD